MIRRLKNRTLRKIGFFHVAFCLFCLVGAAFFLLYENWDGDREGISHVVVRELPSPSGAVYCEVIHVMSVVGGHNATFGFSVLLKSLLSVRHNPLMLHLLVDNSSKLVLHEMLSTWMISGLRYKFYDISAVEQYVSWVPNIHYSGTYGLLKLVVPFVLSNLDKVIVLDTDLLFMNDIFPIWKVLEIMEAKEVYFGLVENQSDWYVKTTSSMNDDNEVTLRESRSTRPPWPALGRGFNSGLILMNIAGLKKSNIGWMDLWKSIAVNNLHVHKYTTLADQDIFNAVFARNPDFVMKLNCDWNFQLSYGSKEDHCLANLTTIFRVLHFNHPEKTALLFDYGTDDMDGLFANVYAKAVETNGYFFRSMFTSCSNIHESADIKAMQYSQAVEDLSPADACYDIRLETVTVRRLFPFFFAGRTAKFHRSASDKTSITLVTHLSFERISQLELICRTWKGSISAALYLNDADLIALIRLILDDSSCLASGDVHIHLVFRHGTAYPVNLLRNVAFRFAISTNIFILDADFIPSPDLESIVLDSLLANDDTSQILQSDLTAIVVPAYDVSSFVDLSLLNKGLIDKKALIDLVDRGLAQSFQSIKWPAGHGPTNYTRWRSATQPYRVEWAPDYEPYVIIRRTKSTPLFDERFVGFGWNKVSYAMQLDALGYSFVVHPTIFALHLPHLPSLDLLRFRSNSLYQTCLENFKLEFVNELASRHGAAALKYLKAMPANTRAVR